MDKLPPLEEATFDGYKSSVTLNPDKKCAHDIVAIGNSSAQCKKCGVGYSGANIGELIELFKKHYSN